MDQWGRGCPHSGHPQPQIFHGGAAPANTRGQCKAARARTSEKRRLQENATDENTCTGSAPQRAGVLAQRRLLQIAAETPHRSSISPVLVPNPRALLEPIARLGVVAARRPGSPKSTRKN